MTERALTKTSVLVAEDEINNSNHVLLYNLHLTVAIRILNNILLR